VRKEVGRVTKKVENKKGRNVTPIPKLELAYLVSEEDWFTSLPSW
jgi:hypothetical protein